MVTGRPPSGVELPTSELSVLTWAIPPLLMVRLLFEERVLGLRLPAARASVPALTTVGPVNVSTALKVTVPLPLLVTAPEPEMTALTVKAVSLRLKINEPLFATEPGRLPLAS